MALQGYGNVVTRQVGFSNHVSVQNVNAPDLNDYINLGAARVFHQQKEEIAHVHFDGFEEIEVETIDSLHSRDLIKCGDREWIMKIDTEGMEKVRERARCEAGKAVECPPSQLCRKFPVVKVSR